MWQSQVLAWLIPCLPHEYSHGAGLGAWEVR
jgi:hypothetical protein